MYPIVRTIVGARFGIAAALVATTGFAATSLPVEQILARNAEARGGIEAWRKVTTISMVGQMDANKPRATRPDYHPSAIDPKSHPAAGATPVTPPTKSVDDPNKVIELPYRLEMKRPLKTRLELDVNGNTAVQVYDGAHGYKLRPFLGRDSVEPYTKNEMELAAAEPELDGPLIDHDRKGIKAVVEGVDKVGGTEAYKIKLTFKNGSSRHVWVDSVSFLEVKMDATRHLDGKDHVIETYLRGYKRFGGLMFPMVTETMIQGVPGSSKITVTTVSVNPAIDDGRFKIETKATMPAKPAIPAKPVAKTGTKP